MAPFTLDAFLHQKQDKAGLEHRVAKSAIGFLGKADPVFLDQFICVGRVGQRPDQVLTLKKMYPMIVSILCRSSFFSIIFTQPLADNDINTTASLDGPTGFLSGQGRISQPYPRFPGVCWSASAAEFMQ